MKLKEEKKSVVKKFKFEGIIILINLESNNTDYKYSHYQYFIQ